MTENQELKPRGPGRPSNAELAARTQRADEVKTRRRRRSDSEDTRNLKLYVPESMKDPNFEYRWVNDRVGRVRQMTVDDDWDVVDTSKLGGDPDPGKNTAEGTVMSRIGDKFTGEKMTLIRKPKHMFDEDRQARSARLAEIEASMKRKAPSDPNGVSSEDNAYVPGGSNTIRRG